MKLMVAFSSPKRSAKVVAIASQHAKALNAELVLCRIVPDAQKVGIIAQLIETERPTEKAQKQVEMVSAQLIAQGVNATGCVRKGSVAEGIITAATELGVSLIFVGTHSFTPKPRFFMAKDPIVHYLVDHCPISLCLIRHDETIAEVAAEDAVDDATDEALDEAMDEAGDDKSPT